MRLIVFPSDLFKFFFGRLILISFNPRPRAFHIGQFRLRNVFPLPPRTLTFDPSSCFALCFAIYIVSIIQLMVLSVQRCLLPCLWSCLLPTMITLKDKTQNSSFSVWDGLWVGDAFVNNSKLPLYLVSTTKLVLSILDLRWIFKASKDRAEAINPPL